MPNIKFPLMLGMFFLISIVQASAILTGGLNYVNENRTWYYDRTAPTVNISDPVDSIVTQSGIVLNTSIQDRNSTSCQYWVMRGASFEVNPTSFNCTQTTFSVSSDATYVVFVNATDGMRLNESNRTFTV